MRFCIFLAALLSTQLLIAQIKIPLRVNRDRVIVSADTGILIKNFTDGLAPFMVKGKDPFYDRLNRVGFIDSAGNVRIMPIYINCSPFAGGKALVMDTNRKVGMIDTTGRLIKPMQYDAITKCDNGSLFFAKDGKFQLYDSTATQKLTTHDYTGYAAPPITFTIGEDIHSLRRFQWYTLDFGTSVRFENFIGVQRDGRWGVINRSGKEVVPPKFKLINVFIGNAAVAHQGNFAGVIDTAGHWLIRPVYRNVVDDKGNYLFPPVYRNVKITPFQTVLVIKNKKIGVLSLKNKVLVPIKYDEIIQLSDSTFWVSRDKGRIEGVMRLNSETVTPMARPRTGLVNEGF